MAVNLTATTHGRLSPADLAEQLSTGIAVPPAEAHAAISSLTAQGLLTSTGGLTAAGKTRVNEITTCITAIAERLYADLPPEDRAATARVLTTVITRARTDLTHP